MTKRERAVSEAAATLAVYFRYVAKTGRVDPLAGRDAIRLMRALMKTPPSMKSNSTIRKGH